MNRGMSNINSGPKNVVNKNIELRSKLSKLECPFNWDLQGVLEKLCNREDFFSELQLKLTEFNENEPNEYSYEVQWYKITVQLLMMFILKTKNDTNGALQKIKECEAIINDLEKKKNDPSFLDEIKPALKHIVLASKAHVVESSGEIVQMLLQEIVPVVEMTNKERAGIKGVKSEICLLMGHEGHQLSIPCAEEAIELNPKESQWWFLAGKAMGRVRRLREKWNYDLIEKKELEYLQKAVDLKKSPSYMVILAQSYRESARAAFFAVLPRPDKERLKPRINQMNKKSFELYKSVLEIRTNSPRSMIRCAQGFLKLPAPYKNVKEAKKIIDKCLEISPKNPYIHHVAGTMYQNYKPNYATALKHLEIASDLGNYEAVIQKIKLKYTLDKTYDPYNDLKSAEKKYKEKSLQIRTEKEFGVYYLFIKRDVLSALKHFSVIVQENKGSSLKAVWIGYFNIRNSINVLKIIADETRLFITDRNPTPEEKNIMKKFLSNIQLQFPELFEKPPVPNQIDNVIKS